MDLHSGHLEGRDHTRFFFIIIYYKVFSEGINCEFSARVYCVIAEKNPEIFTERCSFLSDVLQGAVKIFMEVNHFLLLNRSLEK